MDEKMIKDIQGVAKSFRRKHYSLNLTQEELMADISEYVLKPDSSVERLGQKQFRNRCYNKLLDIYLPKTTEISFFYREDLVSRLGSVDDLDFSNNDNLAILEKHLFRISSDLGLSFADMKKLYYEDIQHIKFTKKVRKSRDYLDNILDDEFIDYSDEDISYSLKEEFYDNIDKFSFLSDKDKVLINLIFAGYDIYYVKDFDYFKESLDITLSSQLEHLFLSLENKLKKRSPLRH